MQENFRDWFKDLLIMEIPELIISPFDIQLENANVNTFPKEEFIEMSFDLEAKSI